MNREDGIFVALLLAALLTVVLPAVWLSRRQQRTGRDRWWNWESFARSGTIMTALTIWYAVSERQLGWSPPLISGGFAVIWFVLAYVSHRRRWTGPVRGRRRSL